MDQSLDCLEVKMVHFYYSIITPMKFMGEIYISLRLITVVTRIIVIEIVHLIFECGNFL